MIGLPITGKYRDPESDQYYNNNNVRRKEDSERILKKNFFVLALSSHIIPMRKIIVSI